MRARGQITKGHKYLRDLFFLMHFTVTFRGLNRFIILGKKGQCLGNLLPNSAYSKRFLQSTVYVCRSITMLGPVEHPVVGVVGVNILFPH